MDQNFSASIGNKPHFILTNFVASVIKKKGGGGNEIKKQPKITLWFYLVYKDEENGVILKN